jgi:microcystin-dependent protein
MIEGNVIGNAGGTQAVTLTVAQMPAHTHELVSTFSNSGEGVTGVNWSDTDQQDPVSIATSSTGGDGAHSNIPPALIVNFVIKT